MVREGYTDLLSDLILISEIEKVVGLLHLKDTVSHRDLLSKYYNTLKVNSHSVTS